MKGRIYNDEQHPNWILITTGCTLQSLRHEGITHLLNYEVWLFVHPTHLTRCFSTLLHSSEICSRARGWCARVTVWMVPSSDCYYLSCSNSHKPIFSWKKYLVCLLTCFSLGKRWLENLTHTRTGICWWCPARALKPESHGGADSPFLVSALPRVTQSLREGRGMAASNFSGLRGISHRVFIIGLSVLVLVQLLVSLTVPRAYSSTSDDDPAFLVISIEKNDGKLLTSEVRKNDLESSLWTDEDSRLTGYEDENELEGPQVICFYVSVFIRSSWYATLSK